MSEDEALEGSISKWESIVAGTGVDLGPQNCPLCQKYYCVDCRGCPVFEKSGKTHCEGTPYDEWDEHHLAEHLDDSTKLKSKCDTCKEIAQAEVDFLKGLRK